MADDIKTSKTAPRNDLTADYLRQILDCDPESGQFIWKETRFRSQAGDIAGCRQEDGYITIGIDGTKYYAHRLVWLYVHGEWPPSRIDHKDRNPSNNSIGNLRAATQRQNTMNKIKQRNNKSGMKGVCFDISRQLWLAYIDGRHIGRFSTFEEAAKARIREAERLHKEFMHI